jgi:hypothetical protein
MSADDLGRDVQDASRHLAALNPLEKSLVSLPDGWWRSKAGRKAATEHDPALFALVYLPHHLLEKGADRPTFGIHHFDWYDQAREAFLPHQDHHGHTGREVESDG